MSADSILLIATAHSMVRRREGESSLARYLVTGAAGFIGRSIAAALLAQGETVRGIDNFITGKRSNLGGLEGMEFVEADLTDPAACARGVPGRRCDFS